MPSGKRIGSEIFPMGVLIILDLNFSEIAFSLTQSKFPPFIAVSEILKLIATFSKPSILILFFTSLIVASNSSFETDLITIQNQKEIEEYLISEIIIKPVPKDKLESTIKEIKNKIKIEGFKKVAMNLSISETALRGGDLGWVSANAISEKFKSKIINTPIGNISGPILLPEGILLFKVRDKRKVKRFESLEDAKNLLVKAEKTKMLRMHSLSHYEKLKKTISINYY